MLRRISSGRAAALLLSFALAAACDKSTGPENQPIPVLLSAVPETVTVAPTATDVELIGENFTRQSRARYNGEDRATQYESSTRLTITLTSEDVSEPAIGRIQVHNPPPAGGTSGMLTVHVVNPGPTVTSVTPPTLLVGDTASFVVRGTNFILGAFVILGENVIETTFVSSTELRARLPLHFAVPVGTQPLRVFNPPPGGGQSNSINVVVQNAAAVIESITPDSVATDATSRTLTVTGRNFFTGATLRWNGSERATTIQSPTRLTAQLNAADLVTPGNFAVTVVNPSAAASNAVNVRIVRAPPRITALSPSSAAAGSGASVITISGTNFTAGSVAEWNGQARPTTFVSATSLQMSITAADLAAPTTGVVTVRDPGTNLRSASQAFIVLAGTPAVISQQTVAFATNSIVYDSVSGLLYASIPSSATQNANAVVAIDPSNGSVAHVIPNVGSNPGPLAVSDDGRFLYAGLLGASRIVRIDLTTRTSDLQIDLPGDNHLGANVVEDILVLRGAPRTVIASLRNQCCSPRHMGVFAWDDGVRRAANTQGHTGSNRITAGPTASAIYGYNNETTEFGFRRIAVTAQGLQEVQVNGGVISGFSQDITSDGSFAYSTNGDVIDLTTLSRVATLPTNGLVAADAAKGRVHYLDNAATLRTFHASNANAIGSVNIPGVTSQLAMVRWGSDGLAIRTSTQIVLVRSTLVGP